jgi:hypothetical protein
MIDEHYTATLTSDCTCTKYDEETGDEMKDKNGEPIPSDVCFDCYGESISDFYDNFIPEWLNHFGLDVEDKVKLHGSRVNWDYTSGWNVVKVSDLLTELTDNIGQFRLTFRLSKDYEELECVRASHDEQGSLFTISKLTQRELEYHNEYH